MMGRMSKPPDSIPDTLLPYATTLMVRDSCLCMQLQRAARSLARRFDQAFRPLGLTNGQFSLLMSLNRPQPPQIGDVADLLGMDRTSITAMLKPLARRGLVEIVQDETDRRGRRLRLLQAGRALLAEAMPVWQRTLATIEGRLADGEADGLRKALAALA
jgi:DNA-binding MarR family transcriptional regulator